MGYSGSTGKTYREVLPNSLTCTNGRWSGQRCWDVDTTSPYIAALTVMIDAGVHIGHLYDEPCDDDYVKYIDTDTKNPAPPLRAHTYNTNPIGEWTRVTVTYEDERATIAFDELSPGYKAHGITSGMETVQVEETLGGYTRWDASGAPNCVGATVKLGSGSYATQL